MNVALRPEASSDLVSAAEYFNDGWGDHFLDKASDAHDEFGEIIVWATLEKDL
jgi:hypothetical protein